MICIVVNDAFEHHTPFASLVEESSAQTSKIWKTTVDMWGDFKQNGQSPMKEKVRVSSYGYKVVCISWHQSETVKAGRAGSVWYGRNATIDNPFTRK